MADLGDLSAGAVVSVVDGHLLHDVAYGYDRWVWANRLAGTVMVDAVGVSRRVVAVQRGTLKYVGSTISDSAGVWSIGGLPKILDGVKLLVMAFDESGTYNAEIFDHVVAVN
jgi:hypothetical protein